MQSESSWFIGKIPQGSVTEIIEEPIVSSPVNLPKTAQSKVCRESTTAVDLSTGAIEQSQLTRKPKIVSIKTIPAGARVKVNDEFKGVTPCEIESCYEDPLLVSLVKNGFVEYLGYHVVKDGMKRNIELNLTPMTEVFGLYYDHGYGFTAYKEQSPDVCLKFYNDFQFERIEDDHFQLKHPDDGVEKDLSGIFNDNSRSVHRGKFTVNALQVTAFVEFSQLRSLTDGYIGRSFFRNGKLIKVADYINERWHYRHINDEESKLSEATTKYRFTIVRWDERVYLIDESFGDNSQTWHSFISHVAHAKNNSSQNSTINMHMLTQGGSFLKERKGDLGKTRGLPILPPKWHELLVQEMKGE